MYIIYYVLNINYYYIIITQDSEKYVERLLMLFRRYSTVVKDAFRDDPRFLTSRDKAYKRVVNDTSVFRLVSCRSSPEFPTQEKNGGILGTGQQNFQKLL